MYTNPNNLSQTRLNTPPRRESLLNPTSSSSLAATAQQQPRRESFIPHFQSVLQSRRGSLASSVVSQERRGSGIPGNLAARPRSDSVVPKEPHSVSLKVLRLSRPSLAQQNPLSTTSDNLKISKNAGLAFPSPKSDQEFVISQNLSLPPAFGSAHLGEHFSCALCVNNELPKDNATRSVSGLRVLADMQTPSLSVPLQMYSAESEHDKDDGPDFVAGHTTQKIIRFDLKEEGNHVLAVNVSYTETTKGGGQATSGRVRTFRKLYQFQVQQCLTVRTKATELPALTSTVKAGTTASQPSMLRYALEAQLENVTENSIVLEDARVQPKLPFKSMPLNWDTSDVGGKPENNPVLHPRDILQVMFLVEQQQDVSEGLEDLRGHMRREGRAVLGQLTIQWRSSMGEKGTLSTGNLLSRRRVG